MSIKTAEVEVKGKSPLLMHQYPMVPIEALEKKPSEEQAELASYRDPDTGELYIPGICFQRSFISAASYSKGKDRASLQKLVAACVMVNPERISLGTKTFKVDARPVVIRATKGRVLRFRPRLDEWHCRFEVDYEDTLLTENQLRKVIDDSGERVGVLDFRPQCNGYFGRFMVTGWKVKK
ncbi:MAG: hypothetical protein ABSG97_09815 [Sedimentisphaerales bacterium]|jgi:hypothetical protein